MGYLAGNSIHVDKHLTNVALAYRPDNVGYGIEIFPTVSVGKQTDMIKVYSQADWFRRDSTLRSPGTSANKVSFAVSSTSYNCKNYALQYPMTIEDRRNADPAFIRDFEEGAIQFLMDRLLSDLDIRIASCVTSTSNVSTYDNVGSSWTNHSNSDPYNDIYTYINVIEDTTGYRPNKMAIGGNSWRHLRQNAGIIDKCKATALTGADKNVNEQQVAQLFELEKIVVCRTFYNTAEEGITQSIARAFGDHCLLYYAPNQPSLEKPSYGYSFRWVAQGLDNMTVRRIPFDEDTQSDSIRIGYYQDEKVVSTALGALVMNTNCSQ